MNRTSFGALSLAGLLLMTASPSRAQSLNDAQVAHIAVTANALDVTAARQAMDRSTNAEVRRFAATMIRDHEGVIEQAAALAERLGVTPQDNETSATLTEQADATRSRLAGLSGPDFDRAYMEHEVGYHEAVIAAVEQTLVPNTENAELKALLQGVVPALRAHLEHARQLAGELGAR